MNEDALHFSLESEYMAAKSSILREKQKETTTQAILAAAEAELAEHGLAATAMSAIAQRAGVSVGTLYNYFQDKEVLLASLLADRRQRFYARIDEAAAPKEVLSFEAQLEAVVNAIFDIFESHRDFLRILLSNEKPTLSKSKDKNQTKAPVTQFVDRLRPVVAKGVAGGVLVPDDADLYAGALAALIRGVMIERLNDTKRPFREATPFVLRLFLHGARIKL